MIDDELCREHPRYSHPVILWPCQLRVADVELSEYLEIGENPPSTRYYPGTQYPDSFQHSRVSTDLLEYYGVGEYDANNVDDNRKLILNHISPD